jgi:hypothetical protein
VEPKILAGIRRELKRLLALDPADLRDCEDVQLRIAAREAREKGTVRIDFPAWFGRELSDSERRAAQRALEALEHRGKLERIQDGNSGTRTTHVRLTPSPEPRPAAERSKHSRNANSPAGSGI